MRRALYRSKLPSAFSLILKTHLQSMMFLPFCEGTKCHVLFFTSASYSTSIACFQFLLLNASSNDRGSLLMARQPYRTIPSVRTLG
jgi:hypothetical protein